MCYITIHTLHCLLFSLSIFFYLYSFLLCFLFFFRLPRSLSSDMFLKYESYFKFITIILVTFMSVLSGHFLATALSWLFLLIAPPFTILSSPLALLLAVSCCICILLSTSYFWL